MKPALILPIAFEASVAMSSSMPTHPNTPEVAHASFAPSTESIKASALNTSSTARSPTARINSLYGSFGTQDAGHHAQRHRAQRCAFAAAGGACNEQHLAKMRGPRHPN